MAVTRAEVDGTTRAAGSAGVTGDVEAGAAGVTEDDGAEGARSV